MDTHSVLLDQAWFRNYDTYEDWARLIKVLHQLGNPSIDRDYRRGMQHEILNPTSTRSPGVDGVYLLERVFEFDRLIIDEMALRLNANQIPPELQDVIVPITPSLGVYQNAGAEIEKEARIRQESESADTTDLNPWSKTEYHESLYRSEADLPEALVRSTPHNDWVRAFFYMAFAEQLGVSPLVSGPKARYLNQMGARTVETQHETVREIFDTAFLERWRSVSKAGADSFELFSQQTPPILEHITSKAINEDVSALTILRDLRESEPAVEYRRLLGELRAAFAGGRKGHVDALRILTGIKNVADSWASELDPAANVRYVPRNLKLRCVPIVGRLLEFADMEAPEVKDRILEKPPAFLIFCANWYSEQFDYEFGRSEGAL